MWVESPSSVIKISHKVSLADERRMVKSDDKNGGKKLSPSAMYTGLFEFGRRNTLKTLAEAAGLAKATG